MAESKIEILLRISDENLARAEKRLEAEENDSAVFHASIAVETVANALILKLGGSEARNHKAISGLAAVIQRIRPKWLKEERCAQLIRRGRELQRELVYARYPLKIADKWITPMEYYTKQKATTIVDDARFVADAIKGYLSRKE